MSKKTRDRVDMGMRDAGEDKRERKATERVPVGRGRIYASRWAVAAEWRERLSSREEG